MNTAHPLAATLAQIHRLSLDGTLTEITLLADQALALLEKTRADVPEFDEATLRDAARYRFIRENKSRGEVDLCVTRVGWIYGPPRYEILCEAEADAAIDNAIPTPNPHEADRNG